MTERISDLKRNLQKGIPYYGMDDEVDREALAQHVAAAQETTIAAHEALQQAIQEGRVVFLDGDKPGEEKMYVTFPDKDGKPCLFAWDPGNPATDIGIRTVNPEYKGTVNPTTIFHADSQAERDFLTRGAPLEAIEAIAAMTRFNQFILREIAKPYLSKIALAFGQDPGQYLDLFVPNNKRPRTLTRAILYHLNAPAEQRPVGPDGESLLIKAHNDKGSYTIDGAQSSPGLQYRVDDEWHEAETRIACFRGAADDYLPEVTPPTTHRAVFRPELQAEPSPELAKRGIARIAIPTFISPSVDGARVVKAGSVETHPEGSVSSAVLL